MPNEKRKIDVLIIGAGPVGLALAIALSKSTPLNIGLVEANEKKPYKAGQGKALALSYGSIQLLEKLSVWERLQPLSTEINEVHVSEKGRFGITKLTAKEIDLPALGYMVSQSDLSHALEEEAGSSRIQILQPAKLSGIKHLEQGVEAQLETALGQQAIECQLLVAADGVDSAVRSLLKIPVVEKPSEMSALVTRVHLKKAHAKTSYQRFTPRGIIAMLPLGNSRYANIISGTHSQVHAWNKLSEEHYIDQLQDDFGYRLGKIVGVDKRMVFPLRQLHSTALYQKKVILLGHAAHVMHPVAAQGLNLSFRDIEDLERLIEEALEQRKPFATNELLSEYASMRSRDQKATMKFTHILETIFSSQSPSLGKVRKAGLLGIEFIPGLKKFLSKRGAGV
jgi:2-octaprenyl-6-methoxyphenol hydroxylase